MIAEEMALYLQTMGHGAQGKNLFLAFQPDSPDNCITVYDESTPAPEESNALSVDEFGVQIIVRNVSYTHARDKILAMHKDLVGFGGMPFISEGKWVHAVFITTAPTSIGQDEKGRSEWTAHYRVRVESQGDLFRN